MQSSQPSSHRWLQRSLAAALALSAIGAAQAHVGYGGRNFGTLTSTSNITIANQAITGNYGWIDAADLTLDFGNAAAKDRLYLGDSHKARAFRFTLDTTLTLSFTAMANPTATAASVAGLLPGFTIYSGLAAIAPFTAPQTSADYDFNPASVAWRTAYAAAMNPALDATATAGSWNALASFKMGGDGDPAGVDSALSSFSYMGHAWDSDANGTASTTLALGPGNYTLFVGGTDINDKGAFAPDRAYGLSLNVTAVPEPQALLLMLLGLPVLALKARRQRR